MAGASVLDGARSVGISDLATHDFFQKRQLFTAIYCECSLKTLSNLVTIIKSRALISDAKSEGAYLSAANNVTSYI